jgi:hypothetical protein
MSVTATKQSESEKRKRFTPTLFFFTLPLILTNSVEFKMSFSLKKANIKPLIKILFRINNQLSDKE